MPRSANNGTRQKSNGATIELLLPLLLIFAQWRVSRVAND